MELKSKNNDVLINIIVAYRKFGFEPLLAKQAMIELSIRRQCGNDFQYEKIIQEKLDKLNEK